VCFLYLLSGKRKFFTRQRLCAFYIRVEQLLLFMLTRGPLPGKPLSIVDVEYIYICYTYGHET
jgi:hypothetical protein